MTMLTLYKVFHDGNTTNIDLIHIIRGISQNFSRVSEDALQPKVMQKLQTSG